MIRQEAAAAYEVTKKLGQPTMRLAGTETSLAGRSAVTCTALSKLPKIGDGLVIPRDSRFVDLDGEEGGCVAQIGRWAHSGHPTSLFK